MILQAFVRFIYGVFLTRFLYRFNSTMIVRDVFRYFKWQPIFYIVTVHRIVECVSWFFMRPSTPMVIRINDYCTNDRYPFHVGISSSFRVDIYGRQGDIMASRRIHFTTMRIPCQRASILFMRDSRKFRRVISALQFNMNGGQIDNAMHIPWKRDTMVCPAINLICFLIKAMVDSVRVAVGYQNSR